MLVTRPEPDASDTAARLGALGIEAATCPLLIPETLDTSLPDPSGFAALVVTSAQALKSLDERGVLERYVHLPLYAVGDRTAEVAKSMGFAQAESASGAFADLVNLLAHAPVEGPILYPAARHLSGDLARSLAPFGRMVITTEIYVMNPVEALPDAIATELASGAFDAVLFYSRRTAQTFVQVAGNGIDPELRAALGMLCISEAVAEPLLDAHFVRVGLADHPSEEAMMGLALSFSRDQND